MSRFVCRPTLFASALLAGAISCAPVPQVDVAIEDLVSVISVDPLEKVLPEVAYFAPVGARADVARGEHASLQFVVRGHGTIRGLEARVGSIVGEEGGVLDQVEVGYVGNVIVGRSTPTPSRDRIASPTGFYPDPILPHAPVVIAPETSQAVWISVAIPVETAPGVYRGSATVSGVVAGRRFTVNRPFTVQVYEPVVEQTKLWVTNWFSMGPGQLRALNGGTPVEPYSDRYWELAAELARTMAAYRQNVALLPVLSLVRYAVRDGQYAFDFSLFDRTARLFFDEGKIGLIEGGHIGGRQSNWTSDFVVSVPQAGGEDPTFERLPVSDPRAQRFYRQFIPALMAHLRENGWEDRYVQHIADEPIAENVASYIEIARLVKELAPGLRLIEAVHSRDVADVVDIWVPQLNFLNEDLDFYKQRQEEGDDVWFYTCLAPQGEYANRFIELPLLKTRLLHWINFKYGVPGYLHWGLNHWRGNPFEETTGIITESGNVLPGGDAWIVYPGEGRFLSSIRLEAMRDGIVDYELLTRYAEKDPDAAAELARQLVYSFERYDMNVAAFRDKRRQLLEALSQ